MFEKKHLSYRKHSNSKETKINQTRWIKLINNLSCNRKIKWDTKWDIKWDVKDGAYKDKFTGYVYLTSKFAWLCFINRVEWYVDSDHIKWLAERHVYCIFHWECFRNNISRYVIVFHKNVHIQIWRLYFFIRAFSHTIIRLYNFSLMYFG